MIIPLNYAQQRLSPGTNDLSRLPLQESCNDDGVSEVSVYNVSEISVLPVSIV